MEIKSVQADEVQVCSFFVVGKAEKKLLAFDEYESSGSGRYFTDDIFMCARYLSDEASKIAKKNKYITYQVVITKKDKKYNTKFTEWDFLSSPLPKENKS